jgi:hypothetical protein
VSKYTTSQLENIFPKELFLIKNLRHRLLLPSTLAAARIVEKHKQEEATV